MISSTCLCTQWTKYLVILRRTGIHIHIHNFSIKYCVHGYILYCKYTERDYLAMAHEFHFDIKLPEFDRDYGLFPGKFGTPGVWLGCWKRQVKDKCRLW